MDRELLKQALVKLLAGVLLVGLLLFLPAGTFQYPQGRLLMAVLFVPMLCAGVVMLYKSPELLRRRLNAREQEMQQKTVIALSGLMFIAVFVLAGLSFRFGWLMLPMWVSYLAALLFLFGYALFAEVLRENEYLSRTVEVQEGQQLVDTGLYGVVRHPMYMSTLVLFFAMPLVLGSMLSFAVMLLYLPIIGARMRNEEEVLEQGLPGYREYKQRVKYKVIPYLW